MFKNYLKIAWRNLTKNKGYTIINVGGLALGMAVALIIGLWIMDELSHNSYFSNKNRIAQVFQSQTFNGETGTGPAIPRPLEMAFRESYMDNFVELEGHEGDDLKGPSDFVKTIDREKFEVINFFNHGIRKDKPSSSGLTIVRRK